MVKRRILTFVALFSLLLGISFGQEDEEILGLSKQFAEIMKRQEEQLLAETQIEETDLDKFSASQLVDQARILLEKEQLLSARTRLLAALKKDPKYYQAHNLLAGYYLAHVGHFRLALKYIKQGRSLFEQQNGRPPYADIFLRLEHGHILYILSQVRLNLDNYQGALDALDEYESFGYFSDWYPSSRAWVLMKLGRIPEAIRLARLGVINSTSKGSSLNMLGILLSVDNQPEASLGIFEQAIRYESLQGKMGRPATPLNNAGEVYRERFRDILAQTYWTRAKKLPDGCEHVLPSLNLAILLLDQLKTWQAEESINSFETCVAQYVMRNDEEHRSLVSLARGRIALQRGQVRLAREKFEDSIARSQWFGKIGTNQNDLKIAALISLAETLEAETNSLRLRIPESIIEYLNSWKTVIDNQLQLWWTLRKARFLFQQMGHMEDIDIRHTDSLLEYPKLGWILKDFPTKSLFSRLKEIEDNDDRPLAKNYYESYRAENLLHHGQKEEGLAKVNALIKAIHEAKRDSLDAALLLRLHLLRLNELSPDSKSYRASASWAFEASQASLRAHGHTLPVNGNDTAWALRHELAKVGFLVTRSEKLKFEVQASQQAGDYVLRFKAEPPHIQGVTVKGNNLSTTLNRLAEHVFTIEGKKSSQSSGGEV